MSHARGSLCWPVSQVGRVDPLSLSLFEYYVNNRAVASPIMVCNFLWLLWGWHAANFTGNKREMEPKELPCCSIPYLCKKTATGNLIVTALRVHVNNQSTWWMFTVYVPVWINQSFIVTLSVRQSRKSFSVTFSQALMTEIDLNEELVYYFGLFLIKRADDGEATSE